MPATPILFKLQFVCVCTHTHIRLHVYIYVYIFHGTSVNQQIIREKNVKSGGLFLEANPVQLNYYFSSQGDKASWEFPDAEEVKMRTLLKCKPKQHHSLKW